MKKSFSPVMAELRHFTPAYLALFFFSIFSPIMYLATPLYMHQVTDRVVLSRNEATLWVLFGIVMSVLIMYTALEYIRGRVLQRIGVAVDERLTNVVFDALNRQRTNATGASSAQPLLDINTVRDFRIAGPMIGGNVSTHSGHRSSYCRDVHHSPVARDSWPWRLIMLTVLHADADQSGFLVAVDEPQFRPICGEPGQRLR